MTNPDARQPLPAEITTFDPAVQVDIHRSGKRGRSSSPANPLLKDGPSTSFPVTIESEFRIILPQPEGEFDPETEVLRQTVSHVREISSRNKEEFETFAGAYLEQLRHEDNIYHFVDVPTTVKEMADYLRKKSNHGLAVYNKLNEVVGFATIADAGTNLGDHWLERAVVVKNLQNNQQEEEGPKGVGKQALKQVTDWGFEHPTSDGRPRDNIYAAVVLFVYNAERMVNVLEDLGFRTAGVNMKQADVEYSDGKKKEKTHTMRMTIDREAWEHRRFRELHEGHPLELNSA